MYCESLVHSGTTTGGKSSGLGGEPTLLVKSDASSYSRSPSVQVRIDEVGHQVDVGANPHLASAFDGVLAQRPQPRLKTLLEKNDKNVMRKSCLLLFFSLSVVVYI